MRVMEMLKGMLAPKYHKRMRGYEHALTERLKGRESPIKKRKTLKCILWRDRARDRGKRSAPFPPKKRRVKRWTLYK